MINNKRINKKNGKGGITGLHKPLASFRNITVVTSTDGQIAGAAASFVVYECRLMSVGNQGFSGGTAAAPTVSTVGLADGTAYALGRAEHFDLEISGVSFEGANIDALNIIFSDTQPSTVITTYALAKAASTSYLHTSVIKAGVATGNAIFKFPKIRVRPDQIVPDLETLSDRDFVATLNPLANSNQEIWCAVILTSQLPATFLTLGVSVNCILTTKVKAFSRLPGT